MGEARNALRFVRDRRQLGVVDDYGTFHPSPKNEQYHLML